MFYQTEPCRKIFEPRWNNPSYHRPSLSPRGNWYELFIVQSFSPRKHNVYYCCYCVCFFFIFSGGITTPTEENTTVDSRYLESQGNLWNTARYPYLDISDLQNWGKKSHNHINKYICNWTLEVRDKLKILWKRGAISPLFHNIFYLLLGFHI